MYSQPFAAACVHGDAKPSPCFSLLSLISLLGETLKVITKEYRDGKYHIPKKAYGVATVQALKTT